MAEPQIYTVKFALNRITRTNESPSWKYVDEFDVSIWEKALTLLSSRNYTHAGCNAFVQADWGPVAAHVKLNASLNTKYHEFLEQEEFTHGFFNEIFDSEKNNNITCEVHITGSNQFRDYQWYPHFFAERYLYDFFCVMNLSVPGSCDFLNVYRIENNKKVNERLHLSSYNFEEALHSTIDSNSPYAKVLDMGVVSDWYEKLGLGVKQKAETQIEKALFSLLHLCKMDGDLVSVVWIFHALEAIYGTRVGESFTNLINRISLLLALNKEEHVRMKRDLRKLYDHRSSIVHGGYKVHFPIDLGSEIDSQVDDDISENYKLVQFGFNLVLASIQALIEKGWYGISVTDSIQGYNSPRNSE